MMAQPALSNGICREFVFPAAGPTSRIGSASGHSGMMISGQMPVFQPPKPAVIRLTHSRPSSKPCSAYSNISNKYVINENSDNFAHNCLYTELEIAKDNVLYNDKNKSADNNFHTRLKSNLFLDEQNDFVSNFDKLDNCPNDVTDDNNNHEALINALLESDSNLRPASKQASNESSEFDEKETDLQNSKPCTRTHSVVSIEHNNTRDNCNSDSGILIKDPNFGAIEDNEKNVQKDSVKVNGSSQKTFTKKGKRSKKRSKSQSSSISKPYIITSNTKIVKIGKMKIPAATKTKPMNDIKKETLSLTIENNLLQVQAQGKPIIMCKQEKHVFARVSNLSGQEVKHKDHRCNTAKTSQSDGAEKMEKPKSASFTLPQMTNNFMVKTDSAVATSTSTDGSTTTRSFIFPNNKLSLHQAHEIARLTKIYLSEKHSGNMKDCGMEFPCAPPATPTPDQLRRYEFIPSMKDIRAQRAVKLKLQLLEKEAQKRSLKQKEDKAKLDKQLMKDREKDMKIRQRREIYALNAVMTDLEHKRFMEFCSKRGLNTG